MNCPKCGKEMGSGFLQTGNIIAFNKTFINIMFSLPSWKGYIKINWFDQFY